MKTHPSMNDLFGLLDKWRHFPAFPLEPRSEMLFALFLPTVLKAHFEKDGVKIKPQVIPQFPLRQNRLDPRTKKRTNHSNNVDFFALSEDGNTGYLIELKTDMSSRRGDQDNYLSMATEKRMDEILCELKEISDASTQQMKYHHLLYALCELNLIKLPSDSKEVSNLIKGVRVPNLPFKPEVVYIQPRKCKEDKRFHYIYFDEFAEIVESQGDMGGLFAGYLRKWTTDPATHPPR